MLTIHLKDGRVVSGDYSGLEFIARLLEAETRPEVARVDVGGLSCYSAMDESCDHDS